MTPQTCESCIYCREIVETHYYQCWRYPPTVTMDDEDRQPFIGLRDFCGEWLKAEKS